MMWRQYRVGCIVQALPCYPVIQFSVVTETLAVHRFVAPTLSGIDPSASEPWMMVESRLWLAQTLIDAWDEQQRTDTPCQSHPSYS